MSTISSHGYVLVYVGKNHPMANVHGYAYEHRLVAAKKIGRMLLPNEIVHHSDRQKMNNSPDNIIVEPSIAAHKLHHRKLHGKIRRLPGEENPEITCACGCGEKLLKYDNVGRARKFKQKHSWRKGRGIKKYSTETVVCSCGCGAVFPKYDKALRERRFISGHNGRIKKCKN